MTMVRKLEINDATQLYKYLSNPSVVRFSRLKPNSLDEMISMISFLIDEEEEKRLISRVITDIHNNPVGMITLWDYCPFRREGFLATWLGEEHWGKGYNQIAKNLFFDELFNLHYLDRIYLLIRNYNERSLAASSKFSYINQLNFIEELELREFYKNKIEDTHVILSIFRDSYYLFQLEAEQTS